jgi:DNA-binding YbaB/EbfC family protein
MEGLPNIPGLGNLVEKAREMGRQMNDVRERLRAETVEASVAGDMVRATVNGAGEVVKIVIDPSAIDPSEKEMLEDLVAAAVNEASKKARERYREEMSRLTGGLDVPGLLGFS